jgi:hypothetical protein
MPIVRGIMRNGMRSLTGVMSQTESETIVMFLYLLSNQVYGCWQDSVAVVPYSFQAFHMYFEMGYGVEVDRIKFIHISSLLAVFSGSLSRYQYSSDSIFCTLELSHPLRCGAAILRMYTNPLLAT